MSKLLQIFRRFPRGFYADCSIVLLSFPLSLLLRFGSPDFLFENTWSFLGNLLLVTVIHALTFKFFKLDKGIWKFIATEELVKILKASSLGISITLTLFYLLGTLDSLPKTSFIIFWILNITSLASIRFLYKGLRHNVREGDGERCLILGAGYGGEHLLRSILGTPNSNLKVLGFIDDNESIKGRSIRGVPILGASHEIPLLISKFGVSKIIIAIPSASSKVVRKLLDRVPKSVTTKILPSVSQFALGRIDFSHVKDIAPEDLLGRRPVQLNPDEIQNLIKGKNVLVTGAGGSIGSELCRQIALFTPENLTLLELNEFSLYEADRKLSVEFPHIDIFPCIGDVADRVRVKNILKKHKPDVIFHAAAYKQVPLMEKSPRECLKNNIIGTKIISESAVEFGVKRFVLVSTDKAVNPTNIMGASKRVAEMICQSLSLRKQTLFSMVRFGNVLGSTGSVVPLFKEQIASGGPITVTHEDVTRYFMSISEACQLVLQAASLGEGNDIFVLEMGEPVKIKTLAEEMIRMAGFRPHKDIEIKITGLRRGEKLYEELFSQKETLLETNHQLVKRAQSEELDANFTTSLLDLIESLDSKGDSELVKKIQSIVKGYVPHFLTQDDSSENSKLH